MVPNGVALMPTLTTRWLESVKVSKQTDFVDRSEPGLMFRVAPSGVKSWSLMYRRRSDNKRRRVSLGRFPETGLAAARAKATRLKEAIAEGADPADAPPPKAIESVNELLDRFLKDHTTGRRWKAEMTRIFAKDFRKAIGQHKIADVKRTHILAVCNAIKDRGGKGISANVALAAIRKAFNWAVSEGYLEISPATGIPQRVKQESRDRALSEAEIRAFWTGIDTTGMADGTRIALRLALVTGQRIGEICSATKGEIDLDRAEWLIPAAKAKNRREHMVPLSPMALELFNAAMAISEFDFLFPARPGLVPRRYRYLAPHSVADRMRRSLNALGLSANPATPHDLRRTVASQMAAMGIPENIVARVLNHSSEFGKTITGKVYIRHSFAAEKRHALEVWAAELTRIVEGNDVVSNVIAMRT
jgi:integrase